MFPLVDIGPKDRIVCIFREGWRFGLYFDFNPDGELAIEEAKRILGTLYRRMKYADLYAALEHDQWFAHFIEAGWFPFIELVSSEFSTLLSIYGTDWGWEAAETQLLGRFDDTRLHRMFARWMERQHLKAKEPILAAAVRAYRAGDSVSVIKIVLTEIEGVMADAYFAATGERAHRIGPLLEFMIVSAEKRAGDKDTLFFPVAFGRYLKDHVYAGFVPGDVARPARATPSGTGPCRRNNIRWCERSRRF